MNNPTDAQIIIAASALGLVSGMRSFAAPAIVGQIARRGGLRIDHSLLGKIAHPTAANVVSLLSAGELIGDKLPMTPARTKPFALIPRIVSGALCGAVVCQSKKKSAMLGAVAGALGALGGTFAAYHLRKWATESLDLPNPAAGAIEDGIAVGLGILITKAVA